MSLISLGCSSLLCCVVKRRPLFLFTMTEQELIELIESRTKAPGKQHYNMSKTISPGKPQFIKVTKRKIKRKKVKQ